MKKKSKFDEFTNVNWSKLWSEINKECGDDNIKCVDIDCDDASGVLSVAISCDSDTHLWVNKHPRADELGHFGPPSVRMRTHIGGGRNHRVREAFLLLMLAIIEDKNNIERDYNE